MLASLEDAPLEDPQLVYEPKYDGIRAIAEVSPGGAVRLWSRLGNEKTTQFPEVVARARQMGAASEAAVGARRRDRRARRRRPAGRISATAGAHPSVSGRARPLRPLLRLRPRRPTSSSTCLREGDRDLRDLPLLERRQVVERLFKGNRDSCLRVSEMVRGDGRALYERALAAGMGRAHREARGLAVQVGQADARTGARSRSPRNRSSSSAAGPIRGRRAPGSARCCSACTKASGWFTSATRAPGSTSASWRA